MQPLYSVDHETRNNSHAQEETVEGPEENTPLLHNFPREVTQRNPLTTMIVSLLLMILIAGVIIGIYLLVLQNESENVLPPVERSLQLVKRSQWDPSHLSLSEHKSFPYRLREVIVAQTGTEQCLNTTSCSMLLQEIKANATIANNIPFNFLISSNGQTYEALGWQKSSPLFSFKRHSGLLIGFIGNFTQVPPTKPQLEGATNLLEALVSQQYLHPSYRIVGRNINDTPIYLTQSLKVFPQWSCEFIDTK